MPNWCTGSLKMRGKHDDILKFLTEGVGAYEGYYIGDTYVNKLLPKDKWLVIKNETELSHDDGYKEDYICYCHDLIYVKGSDRAYLNYAEQFGIVVEKPNSDRDVVTFCSISQAWDFRTVDWIKISKQYNLDLKLCGIECGLLFEHLIDIRKGELVQNTTNTYKTTDEFNWECPFPWLGG